MARHRSTAADWLDLTDLGRIYGISASRTARLLAAAGLAGSGGVPSATALAEGLARLTHGPERAGVALWHRQGCAPRLERQGLVPQAQPSQVSLWADLLSALQQGSAAVSITAEDMADDLPQELVRPVNRELRLRGCPFQVATPLRRAATPRPACSPAPAADASAPHRCD